MLRPRQRFQHLDRGNDVMVDRLALLVGERAFGDRQILDFVLSEKVGGPTRDVGPLVAGADLLHPFLCLRRHEFSPNVAVTQELAVAFQPAQALPQFLLDLPQSIARIDFFQRGLGHEVDLLLERSDFQIALQHLEARVQEIDAVEDRLQLGRLVHDVHRRRHFSAVMQQTCYFELVSIFIAHVEISKRPVGGLVDGLGKHHGKLRHAFAVPTRVVRLLVNRGVDERDE